MIGICIESSHQKGMGHLFRALNFARFLEEKREPYIVFVNNNEIAIRILKEKKIPFDITDYYDEIKLIQQYNIDIWVNDRLNTKLEHARNVISQNCKLANFDDLGEGAKLADLNFSPLHTKTFSKKNFNTLDYLILNKEIDKYKKHRTSYNKMIVTLGGSDTYGVTIKIVGLLKAINKKITILIGPSFKHINELNKIVDKNFTVKQNVPSLMKEFSYYDLAITGGGITPFEANASGLPCIIIANESWEIDNAKILEKLGSSVYAGHHTNISTETFLNIDKCEKMSTLGLQNLNTNAIDKIYYEIKQL